MNDMIEDYRRMVVKFLSPDEGHGSTRLAEILFLPSFHPEALLRIVEDPSGTILHLSTFSSSLWHFASDPVDRPVKMEETVRLAEDRATIFWEAMDTLEPGSIGDSRILGVDGIQTYCRWGRECINASFEAWSPKPDSEQGRFIWPSYQLAWETLQSRFGVERLEHLHGYLGLGLPIREIPGRVRCVRIFGSLAASREVELRAYFDSIPEGEPLVIDMTNFAGMGTLLYPTFVEIASSRTIAWAVRSSVRRHLTAMKLPHPDLFDTLESAVECMAQHDCGPEGRNLTGQGS